jgi:hypothetical protein
MKKPASKATAGTKRIAAGSTATAVPAASAKVTAPRAPAKVGAPVKRPAAAAKTSKSEKIAASIGKRKAVLAPEAIPAKSVAKSSISVPADTDRDQRDADNPAVSAALRTKLRKPKLVRDSFTMPEKEYAVLGEVKEACLAAGIAVKKSELLRVGVALVGALGMGALKAHVSGLVPLKSGRPKQS